MINDISNHLPAILEGVRVTLELTTASFVLAAILAVPLVAGGRSRHRVLRVPARMFVDLVRSIPPLVWLFLMFFGLADTGIVLSSFAAAALGLGIFVSAYMAEVYKGGLMAVDHGQWEAATSLAMSRIQVARFVVGPQAFRVALPAAGTVYIGLLKDTAVASIVGVVDITSRTLSESRQTDRPMNVFVLAILVYIILSLPFAIGVRAAYRRMLRSSL